MSPVYRPRIILRELSGKVIIKDSLNQLVLLATNRNTFCSEICLFTGTVYWGVMLPPSMLRAKGAAIFYSTPRRNLQ